MLVISGSGATKLGQNIASELGSTSVGFDTRKFPDGERYVRLKEKVAGEKIAIVQSMFGDPDSLLFEYVMLVDAAVGAGASEVVGVFPYLAYLRQDERFNPGETLSSKVVADIIQSSRTSRVFVVDPHLHRIRDINQVFNIPAFNITAMADMAKYAETHFELKNPLVVAPDEEAMQWASKVASSLNTEFVVAKKVRLGDLDVRIEFGGADVAGRDVILVDDIVSTGGTLASIGTYLKKTGANKLYAFVTHGLFAPGAYLRIKDAGINEIVTTDTVPNRYSLISVASTIANALRED